MAATAQASLNARLDNNVLAISRDGSAQPLIVQRAEPNLRPYLHPILAPDGRGILTEDKPPHHAWQHGLYVGLNDINGIGFWTEGLTKSKDDGTFHPRPLTAAKADGKRITWSVVTDWRASQAPTPRTDRPPVNPGANMLVETQGWTLTDAGSSFTLDLEWTLAASIDLTFGKYAYGGLFLRMPFKGGCNGVSQDSEGRAQAASEGQRSRWVAVAMNIDGRDTPAGMAIMDHPTNVEHPQPWRVDGQLGIAPSRCIAGAWTLARGDRITYRHRVLVFCNAINPALIEQSFNDYSRS